MKKAVILHAWFGSPEADWYPWLKEQLEKKSYKVWVPKLPTMEGKSPDMETMLKFVTTNGFVDKDTVVIGHSLGSVLTLRLAERIKFGKGIVFAAWDYNDLTPEHQSFWKTMMDHKKIKENVPEWIVPISDNDPYVTKFIAHEVADRIGGNAIDVGSKGHFLNKDGVETVPEILPYI